MTDRRAEIEDRLSKATPGPWRHTDSETVDDVWDAGLVVVNENRDPVALVADQWYEADEGEPTPLHDADLIAHAPSDLRWLLDRLAEAERERDDAREIARLAEESETGWRKDADEAWAALAALREQVQALADEWDHNGGAWDECASCLRALLDEGGESDA